MSWAGRTPGAAFSSVSGAWKQFETDMSGVQFECSACCPWDVCLLSQPNYPMFTVSASLSFAWVSHSHCISLLGLNFNPTLQSAFLSFVSISPFLPDCTWLPISLTWPCSACGSVNQGSGFSPGLSQACAVFSLTLRFWELDTGSSVEGELLGVDSHHHSSEFWCQSN